MVALHLAARANAPYRLRRSRAMTSLSQNNAPRVADVAVIGCGIVGLSAAYYLRKRGLSCVLIDAKGPAGETSFGNAGSISVGNVMPQSTPGIVWKALRM